MNRGRGIRVAAAVSGALLAACPSAEYAEAANNATVHKHGREIASSATCNVDASLGANDIPTSTNRLPLRLETTVQQNPDIDAVIRAYPSRATHLLHLGQTSIIGFDVRVGRKDTHDTNSIKRSLTIFSTDNPIEANVENTVIFEPLKNHRKGDRIAVYLQRAVDVDDFRTTITGLSPCGILENTGENTQPWELQPTPTELRPLVYEEEHAY